MARPLALFAARDTARDLSFRPGASTPTRLLTRLFFRRFLDNDLMAPAGEMHGGVAFLLALLAAPGFFNLAWLLFTYSGPFLTPGERLLLALDHKYQFLACSMIVTALGTTLEWDALSIDGRDLAVLGPLPIATGMLWRAKVFALLQFLSLFAIAVNLVPTLGFPAVWLSLVPIGFGTALHIVGVHALTSVAAAIFGFCSIIAIRSVLHLACGPRLFRALSTLVQFALALALLVAFLLLPVYSSNVRAQLRRPSAAMLISPPLWFVGVYEKATASALLADPDLVRDSTWRFWEREQVTRTYRLRRYPGLLPEAWVHPTPVFRTEAAARRTYLDLQPALDRLAGIGAVAFALVVMAAGALYYLAHMIGPRPLVVKPLREWFSPAIGRLPLAGPPVAHAIGTFTLLALTRSAPHRIYLAAFIAIGGALAGVALIAARYDLAAPTPMLLSLQLLLAFSVLAGIRAASAVPAALEANWVFRATAGSDVRVPLRGVRRAVAVGTIVPLFGLLAPLHALAWGPRVAVLHFFTGVLCALVLLELLLLGSRSIPFASAWVPGRGNLRGRWPLYLLGLIFFTQGFGAIECAALRSAWLYAALLGVLCAALGVLHAAGRRLLRGRQLVFDEPPDPAVLTLFESSQ